MTQDWTWTSPAPGSFDELNGMLNPKMKALENKLASIQDLGIFNVKDYGAVGDGLTNDLTAIQAAIDEAETVKGRVYLPHGDYYLGATATGLVINDSIVFEGASSAGTILLYRGSGVAVTIYSVAAEQVTFRRITVDGNPGGVTGVEIGNPPTYNAKLRMEDVRVRRFTTGISILAMQGSIFDRVRVSECTNDGVLLNSGGTVLITSSMFRNCYVHANLARGFRVLTAGSCHWLGGVIETNDEEGIKFDNAYAAAIQGCSIRGVHFEQNNDGRGSGAYSQLLYTSSSSFMSRMEVRNCHFVTAGAGNYHIGPGDENEVYMRQNFFSNPPVSTGILKDELSRVRTQLRTVLDGTNLQKTASVDGNGAITVVDTEVLLTNHGSSTNIDGIVAASNAFPDGSQVLVWFGDNNTTVRHGQFPATANARSINLRDGADFQGRTNDFLVLIFRAVDGVFREVYRTTESLLSSVTTLADDATPTVLDGKLFKTGGTTTITDFDDGVVGQTIKILSEHAITITDGTNILLNGSADFVTAAGDVLVLTMYNDQVWVEDSRQVN